MRSSSRSRIVSRSRSSVTPTRSRSRRTAIDLPIWSSRRGRTGSRTLCSRSQARGKSQSESCSRKVPSAVAAILGVLKAGKFYVPLDPHFPEALLVHTLGWVGARVVATDSKGLAHARSVADVAENVVLVDRLRDRGDDSRLAGLVSAGDLAYVFFTSGSTGKPKGVFDSHRNVLHNVRRYTNALAISADDRLTLLQSCAFSGSVSSLFGALLNGATVFPFDFAGRGPVELRRLLQRERLTLYHSVPSIFRSFLTGTAHFPDMRVIRLEGDRASSLDADLYKRYFGPNCVLANGLGTTETGLCRQYLIDRSIDLADGILPVGFPVEDMDVEIVDEQGLPVGVGEQGEIVVRSRHLALGYWRRTDLTNAAFRPEADGRRTYRTGDIGRIRLDGCLEYLARKDFAAEGSWPPRGHRRGRVPADRGRSCDRRDRHDSGEGKRRSRVGRVRCHRRRRSARVQSALRSELSRTLPGYLIPTRFVQMDALPVNESGKVDRNNLPLPTETRTSRRRQPTLPRTPWRCSSSRSGRRSWTSRRSVSTIPSSSSAATRSPTP